MVENNFQNYITLCDVTCKSCPQTQKPNRNTNNPTTKHKQKQLHLKSKPTKQKKTNEYQTNTTFFSHRMLRSVEAYAIRIGSNAFQNEHSNAGTGYSVMAQRGKTCKTNKQAKTTTIQSRPQNSTSCFVTNLRQLKQ